MKFPKPTEADRERFQDLVPADDRVVVKPMFGNIGALVNGNMFMGLFGSAVGVKLDEADLQALLAAGGGPFGPDERPMGGFASLPAGMSEAEAAPWIGKALAFVATLPKKNKKK
jgi:TfoX/Sxy family transcriptional regulator of competence genes